MIECLNDGFVKLVEHMGSDSSICNAARVSYGNHNKGQDHPLIRAIKTYFPDAGEIDYVSEEAEYTDPVNKEHRPGTISFGWGNSFRSVSSYEEQYDLIYRKAKLLQQEADDKNRNLIRYLMRHRHTTPFEMVSFVFLVRAPIHVARQWFRHRTWSYNEYSTRYKEAIDSFETTEPDAWRTQATDNKQGSGDFLTEWPNECTYEQEELDQDYDDECFEPMVIREVNGEVCYVESEEQTLGEYITESEGDFHNITKNHYTHLLRLGVAREQARKDLPLSTYTEFYAKVDLHNLFHFLSLRLDSHAQLEIRVYAEAIASIIKPIVPLSYEAFEDYRLNGAFFSAQELSVLTQLVEAAQTHNKSVVLTKPLNVSDREWIEFLGKIS